jgi:hypothetical protein
MAVSSAGCGTSTGTQARRSPGGSGCRAAAASQPAALRKA